MRAEGRELCGELLGWSSAGATERDGHAQPEAGPEGWLPPALGWGGMDRRQAGPSQRCTVKTQEAMVMGRSKGNSS